MSDAQLPSPGQSLDLHTGLSRDMGQMYVSSQSIAPIASKSFDGQPSISSEHLSPAPLKVEIPDDLEVSQPGHLLDLPSEDFQSPAAAPRAFQDASSASPATGEKKCRQCSATKTPMWRNDIDGNKTLCNACGVRLQRQVNKAKQVAQQQGEPPPSLIAGKMPRSRTSPAKLSKQEQAVGSDLSQSPVKHHSRRPSTASLAEDRSSGRSDGMSKRKSLDSKGKPFERKRSCNDLNLSANSFVDNALPSICECDLVVIGLSNGVEAAQRISNCTASVDLHVPGALGSPPGRLQIHLSSGRIAASCGYPKVDCEIRYDDNIKAWRWDGTAQWKLLFLTREASSDFEALLRRWKAFAQNRSYPASMQASPTQDIFSGTRRSSLSFGNLGEMAPLYKMSGSDAKFLAHVNSKIRLEAGSHPLTTDPKGLCTPVSEEVFEKLLSTFELLRQRSSSPQALSEQTAAALCQKCPWTPNRAVGIAIFRYWYKKAQMKAMASSPGNSPSLFTDSSPVLLDHNGFNANSFTPVRSDVSASTLHDMSRLQQGRGSEDSSAGSYRFCSPIDSSSVPQQMPFPPSSAFSMPEASFPMGTDAMFGGSGMYGRSAWDASYMVSDSRFAQPATEDWDPLDPENLAKIADPSSPAPVGLEGRRSSNLQTGAAGMSSYGQMNRLGYVQNMATNNENFQPAHFSPVLSPLNLPEANPPFPSPDLNFQNPQYRKDLLDVIEQLDPPIPMGLPNTETQGPSFVPE